MLRSIYLTLMGITASEISRSWSVWVLDCLFLLPPPPHPPGSFNFLGLVYSNFPPFWAKYPLPPGTNVIKISEKKRYGVLFSGAPVRFLTCKHYSMMWKSWKTNSSPLNTSTSNDKMYSTGKPWHFQFTFELIGT